MKNALQQTNKRKFQLGQIVSMNRASYLEGICEWGGKGKIVSFDGDDRYFIEWEKNPIFSTTLDAPIWEGWLSSFS